MNDVLMKKRKCENLGIFHITITPPEQSTRLRICKGFDPISIYTPLEAGRNAKYENISTPNY